MTLATIHVVSLKFAINKSNTKVATSATRKIKNIKNPGMFSIL